ncbi:Tn3 family transposase [Klebsiella pneumoniae]
MQLYLKTGTAGQGHITTIHRNNIQHPTYKALAELGKAIKTIFLYPLFTR